MEYYYIAGLIFILDLSILRKNERYITRLYGVGIQERLKIHKPYLKCLRHSESLQGEVFAMLVTLFTLVFSKLIYPDMAYEALWLMYGAIHTHTFFKVFKSFRTSHLLLKSVS